MYIYCSIAVYFLLAFSSSTASLVSSNSITQSQNNVVGNSANTSSSSSSSTATFNILSNCLNGLANCTNGLLNLVTPTVASNGNVDNTVAGPQIKSLVTIDQSQWPIMWYDSSLSTQMMNWLKPSNKTSAQVPLETIASSVYDNSAMGNIGAVIIGTGDSSLGEWQVSTTANGTQFATITGLLDNDQMTTVLGTQFTNLFSVYHIPLSKYSLIPTTILLLSPFTIVRFQSSVTDSTLWSKLSCTNSSLLFLAVNWAAISQNYRSQNSTTVLITQECTECASWPISQDIVRICPEFRNSATTTATTTTKAVTTKAVTTPALKTKALATTTTILKTTPVTAPAATTSTTLITTPTLATTPTTATTTMATTSTPLSTASTTTPTTATTTTTATSEATTELTTTSTTANITPALADTPTSSTTTVTMATTSATLAETTAAPTTTTPTLVTTGPTMPTLTTSTITTPITTISGLQEDSQDTTVLPSSTAMAAANWPTEIAENTTTVQLTSPELFSTSLSTSANQITDPQLTSTAAMTTSSQGTSASVDATSQSTAATSTQQTVTSVPFSTETTTASAKVMSSTANLTSFTFTLTTTTTIPTTQVSSTLSPTSSNAQTTEAQISTITTTAVPTVPSSTSSSTKTSSFSTSTSTPKPSTSTSTVQLTSTLTSTSDFPVKTTVVPSPTPALTTSTTSTTSIFNANVMSSSSPSSSSSSSSSSTRTTHSDTSLETKPMLSPLPASTVATSTASTLKTASSSLLTQTTSKTLPFETTVLPSSPSAQTTSTTFTSSPIKTTVTMTSSSILTTASTIPLTTTAVPSSSSSSSSTLTTSITSSPKTTSLSSTATIPLKTTAVSSSSSSSTLTSSTTSSQKTTPHSSTVTSTAMPSLSTILTPSITSFLKSTVLSTLSSPLSGETISSVRPSSATLSTSSSTSTVILSTTTVPLSSSTLTTSSLKTTTPTVLSTTTSSSPSVTTTLSTSFFATHPTTTIFLSSSTLTTSSLKTTTPAVLSTATSSSSPSVTTTLSTPLFVTHPTTKFSISSSTTTTSPSTNSPTIFMKTEPQPLSSSMSTMFTLKDAGSTSAPTETESFAAVTPFITSETTAQTLSTAQTTVEPTTLPTSVSMVYTSHAPTTQAPPTTAPLIPTTVSKETTSASTSTSASQTTTNHATPTETPAMSSDTTWKSAAQTTLQSTATSSESIKTTESTEHTPSTTKPSTTKHIGPDCNGVQEGSAYVNKCGFCVNGTTGLNNSYGYDKCNVCNGTNACVGCDGVPWSGLKYDQCHRCLASNSPYYGIPCTAVTLYGVFPMLLDSQQSKNTLSLSVADTSDQSSFVVKNCWLVDSMSVSYNGTAVKVNKTIITLEITQALSSGLVLTVHCIINGNNYSFPDQVLVTDFEQAVKQSGVSSTVIDLGSDTSVLVLFVQTIPSKYFTEAPSCLLLNGTVLPALRSGDSGITCDLSSIRTNGTIQLQAVRGAEMLHATIAFQQSVTITIQDKKPAITSVLFSDDLTSVLINFNENIQVIGGQCLSLFPSITQSMFGVGFTCSIRGSTIVATFGQNATLMPKNDINVDLSQIERFTGSSGPSSPPPQMFTAETQNSIKLSTRLISDSMTAAMTQPVPTYSTASVDMPNSNMNPELNVDAPQKLTVCQDQIVIDVRRVFGDGGRSLDYTYTISSLTPSTAISPALNQLVTSTNDRTLTIPRSLLVNATDYEVTVVACNFVSQCSDSLSMPISVSVDTTAFEVTLRGLNSPILPSKRTNVAADPTFQKCGQTYLLPPTNVLYSWLINNVAFGNRSALRIAPFQYVPGQSVTIQVGAEYTDPDTNKTYTATATSQFVVSSVPLIVVVDGTSSTVNAANDLVIDCSQSNDPNLPPNAGVQHNWTCQTSAQTACEITSTVDWTAPVLTVLAGSIPADQMYTFTDSITSGGLQGSAIVNVTVVSADIPSVELQALDVERPNVNEYIRFRAAVSSTPGVLATAWSFVQVHGCAFVDLTTYFSTTFRNFSAEEIVSGQNVMLSFTLPPAGDPMYPTWPGLATAAEYILRIDATNDAGHAYSELNFITNAPPTIGQLIVDPMSSIVALETSVQFSVGDGWQDLPEDYPFTYQFGLRTVSVGNQLQDTWFSLSSQDQISLYLSSAWPAPYGACDTRTGYQALLMVCDRLGACSQTMSPQFIVSHPTNLSAAVSALTLNLNSDLDAGNSFDASQKMQAIRQEQCVATLNPSLTEKIVVNVLSNLTDESDMDELANGVDQTLLLLPVNGNVQSNDTLKQLARVASSLRHMIGLSDASTGRRKRSTTTTIVPAVTPAQATTLLKSYDALLNARQDLVTTYLQNIMDIVAGFCVQLDRTQGPMSANGPLTYTQSQVVDASNTNLPNLYYTAADSNGSNVLSVNSGFQTQFASWQCGNPPSPCIEVCIATASISESALDRSSYLNNYFFVQSATIAATQYINRSRLQSDIYQVSLVDQLEGDFVSLGAQSAYRIQLPINSFIPALYYSCYLFIGGLWDNSKCLSVTVSEPGTTYMDCTCSVTGFLGIFTVPPPVPVPYTPQDEISIAITLDYNGSFSPSQVQTMLNVLANTTGIVAQRFVEFDVVLVKNQPTLAFIMRPPFRPDQLSNSYAVQALNRTLNTAGATGLLLYSSGISVHAKPYTLNAQPIPRELQNDGNARMVTILIDGVFSQVVTDPSSIGSKWMTSIATTLGVETYRIKNSNLTFGSIIMSMTVTKPATTEDPSTAISAEELAIMISEQVTFGELLILDQNNLPLTVIPNGTQIVTLIQEPASAQSHLLLIILGGGIGSFFIIVIVLVLVMVILKVRAEQHRRQRMWSADNALLESIQSKKSMKAELIEPSSSSSGSSSVRFEDSAESRSKRKRKRKSASQH